MNLFRGVSPPQSPTRVFGGQVAGQALVAAGRTVPADREVHSLHAYFIRPGDPRVPIVYEAERVRDGRSFTTRRVLAIQHGEAIFSLSASFQVPQEGLEHTEPAPAGVPEPESLPDLGERVASGAAARAGCQTCPRPLDIRFVDEPVVVGGPRRADRRADAGLDARRRHAARRPAAARLPAHLRQRPDAARLGARPAHDQHAEVQMASLDHAMWFHRPFRADEWLLYTCYSPSASGSRGLATGRFTTRTAGWWRRRCRRGWSAWCGSPALDDSRRRPGVHRARAAGWGHELSTPGPQLGLPHPRGARRARARRRDRRPRRARSTSPRASSSRTPPTPRTCSRCRSTATSTAGSPTRRSPCSRSGWPASRAGSARSRRRAGRPRSSSRSPRSPAPATTSSPAAGLYGGTITQLDVTLRRFGVDTTFVAGDDPARLRRGDHRPHQAACSPRSSRTRRGEVADIAALAEVAHAARDPAGRRRHARPRRTCAGRSSTAPTS